MARLHILHIEDDPPDAELIELTLRRAGLDFDIRLVTSRAECTAALQESDFDLVLSDSHSHDFTAALLLDLVREHQPDVPFIFLSGSFEDTDSDALKAQGASDCVLKDHLGELLPVIRRLLPGRAV